MALGGEMAAKPGSIPEAARLQRRGSLRKCESGASVASESSLLAAAGWRHRWPRKQTKPL